MLCLFSNKKKKEKKINFQENGSKVLEELIECSGGKYNPIRSFSSHQILHSTNHFDRSYIITYQYGSSWYKGMIENRCVLIKKFADFYVSEVNKVYRDIAISSMMSSHKNVLKLLGYCLEFPLPILVFEYPENGALYDLILAREGATKAIPWNVRLKIAKEIAETVTYLHTNFPRIIIHRDLNLNNVFLDDNWSVKLSSFGLSILIPEGESGIDDFVVGAFTYIEPDYARTGFVTENVDIYSFGIIMLILLTRSFPLYVEEILERGQFNEIIDPSMLESPSDDIPKHQKLQMEAFLELAFRCLRRRPGEDILHMIDVAKELKRIQKLTG